MAENNVQIISLNVGDYGKRKYLYSYFRELKADIILLQETHCTPDKAQTWQTEWGGEWYNSFGSSNTKGVAILLTKRLKNCIRDPTIEIDKEGRLIICNLEIERTKYMICNIYNINEDNPAVLHELIRMMNNKECDYIVVGGDFNFVIDDEIDSFNRLPSHARNKTALSSIMEELNLSDIWRNQNPEKRLYTWKRTKQTDYFHIWIGFW